MNILYMEIKRKKYKLVKQPVLSNNDNYHDGINISKIFKFLQQQIIANELIFNVSCPFTSWHGRQIICRKVILYFRIYCIGLKLNYLIGNS